ncbi:MAG: Mur ligase family protein [Pseudomonadota bacterium]
MTKNAHFIGLCGAGMSAVARLMQQQGDRVTGSDAGFYPPISDYITKLGLTCEVGYAPSNIPQNVDVIVIGKHAKLTPEENEEVAAAFTHHRDKIRSFPEILSALTDARDRVVIAGSYGKSSLTSLVTWCLEQAGKNPGWFIGAVPKNLEYSSSLGGDGPFVFEGDEYPSANWDDRAKFLHYHPSTVILTSATHDHINIYPTLDDFHAPFHALLTQTAQSKGMLIACADEPHAAQFFETYDGPKISYGITSPADYRATDITLGHPTRFTLQAKGKLYPGFTTSQLGQHNVENICGAAAYLLGQNLLTLEEFQKGVATFEGLTRRLDRKAPKSELPIFEGFGSSYEKARAAMKAILAHFPERRLVVMFEPHTFTWRNKDALDQYETAFEGAEKLWIFEPPVHGKGSHNQASLDEIYAKIRQHHDGVHTFTAEDYQDVLSQSDPQRDVLLILSSGSFGGTLQPLLDEAEKRFSR